MLNFFKLIFKNVSILFKVFFVLTAIFFIPKFFLLYAPTGKVNHDCKASSKFKLGLENIPRKLLLHLKFGNKSSPLNVGLITNHTGVDQQGNRTIDVLLNQKIKIQTIFTPEHGLTGKVQAAHKVENEVDEKTNIPVVSLYLGNSKFKKFTQEDLINIDAFIFDMQDSGMRHYTYISTLFKMMEVAAEFNKEFIVLDRPNPLGCVMEGPLVEAPYLSFISIAPVPLRHGMTIGEIAKYFKKFRIKNSLKLIVVPMYDYNRTNGLDKDLPIFLSPNLQTLDSCYGYSFLCILAEGIKLFSAAVGTDRAFQCLLLPDNLGIPLVRWYELRKILPSDNVKSNITAFQRDNQKYSGLKIKIEDINNFSAFNTLLDIAEFFKKCEIKYTYSNTINKLVGTSKFKDMLDGKIKREDFVKSVNSDLDKFYKDIKDLLIYYPFVKVTYAK